MRSIIKTSGWALALGGLAVAAVLAEGGTPPKVRPEPKSGTEVKPASKPVLETSPVVSSFSQSPAAPSRKLPAQVLVEHAQVTSLDPIRIPAKQPGTIKNFSARKGDQVEVGRLLGQMDDADAVTKKKIAEFERDAAQQNAESDYELLAAKEGAKVTEENFKSNQKLHKTEGAVSDFEMRKSFFEWQRALAQIGVAEKEKAVAKATQLAKQGQIEAAENEIKRCRLESPINGVVVQMFKHGGEWCQPGDPIMEVVRMDRVEVEGFVFATEVSPRDLLHRNVKVSIILAGDERREFFGKILFASPVIEGSGRTRQFRVSTEIDNVQVDGSWLIQPGAEASLAIDLTTAAAAMSKPENKPEANPTATPIGNKLETLKPSLSNEPAAKSTEKSPAAAESSPAKSAAKPEAKSGTKKDGSPAPKKDKAPGKDLKTSRSSDAF